MSHLAQYPLYASFGLLKEADAVELAVDAVLAMGYRTADMKGSEQDKIVGCKEMGRLIAEAVR